MGKEGGTGGEEGGETGVYLKQMEKSHLNTTEKNKM